MPFLWKQLFSSSSIITRSIHQNLSRRSCYLQTFPQSRHFFLPKVPPRTQHQYNYFPQSFQLSGGGPIFPLYHQKHNFHTGELLNFAAMPPISQNLAVEKMEEFIKANEVMVFSKSYCPFCKKVRKMWQFLETFLKFGLILCIWMNGMQLTTLRLHHYQHVVYNYSVVIW